MFNSVVDRFKKIITFFPRLESLLYYFLGLLFTEKEKTIDSCFSPEEVWEIFLQELDELFNKNGVHLDYALSTACANTFVLTNVYVLEDPEYNVFSYYEIIFEKIRDRYIELIDNYFNLAGYDFKTACKIAKDHVVEEMHVSESIFENLKDEYAFNERKVIDVV